MLHDYCHRNSVRLYTNYCSAKTDQNRNKTIENEVISALPI
jgi:hypothetical protein